MIFIYLIKTQLYPLGFDMEIETNPRLISNKFLLAINLKYMQMRNNESTFAYN